ncbi:hypothetical protein [Micromonospora pallida]|uniref:hypothetical protein n=1 Tax=Micromonospora pallida TaxID=145854 RepID=UPI00114D097B|nr:hypothetical protein [Micromonospora pallida]
MTTRTGRRLTTALLAVCGGLLLGAAGVAPASAAPTGDPASLTLGRLVLDPTSRGYQGSLPVTVTNESDVAEYFYVRIVEPVAGSFRALDPGRPAPSARWCRTGGSWSAACRAARSIRASSAASRSTTRC